MFSRGKFPRPIEKYSLEFTWITTRFSNKKHVKKRLCPTKMLWIEKIMFFRPECNIKQVKNRNGLKRNNFWS